MSPLPPAARVWRGEAPQDRGGKKWNLRAHANTLSQKASCVNMELQRTVNDHEVDIRKFQCISNRQCISPARRPNNSQYVEPFSQTIGAAPPVQSSVWQWGATNNPIVNGELPEASGDVLELVHQGYHRTFRTAPFHGASDSTPVSQSFQNGSLGRKQVMTATEEAQTHQQSTDDLTKTDVHTVTPIRRIYQGDNSRFCNGQCAKIVKGLANDVWIRETAFMLKEEAEAAKKKSPGQPLARLRSRKASRVVLAGQAKGSRDSLSLCPLRFTDKSMEREYVFNQERSASFRNTMAGITASCLIFVNIVVSVAAWYTGVFLNDALIFGSSVAFLAFSNIFALLYAISYRIPVVREHLEYSSYFLATTAVVLHSFLSLWWKSTIYSDDNYAKFEPVLNKMFGVVNELGDRTQSVVYHIVVMYNELLVGVMVQGTLLLICVVFGVLTPTRFFIASWLQTFITLVGIAPFLYGAFELPETLLSNIGCIISIFTLSVASFAGCYPREVQRRGIFYEWLSMKRSVVSLLRTRKKALKAAGSTSALDDIRSNCNQIKSILVDLKIGAGELDVAAGLSQALTLIHECLFISATCKNLYLTTVDEDLKDDNFIKAFNLCGSQSRNLLNADTALASNIGRRSHLEPSGGEKLHPEVQSRAGHFLASAGEIDSQHAALLLPVVGLDLRFDPLMFERTHGNGRSSVLLTAGTALLSRVASEWGCDDTVLRNFLIKIDGLYQHQPYHNSKHGTLVAHTMSLLCRTLGIFKEMNALGIGSCLIAGLCHDVGHPGRNNNFFVSEMSPLSILFNDASVLENFHCSLTFRVLEDERCNIFSLLSDIEIREVRSKIIDLILATDMRTHFEFLNRFRTIRDSDQFNYKENDDDRWLAAELCIRASDIGHGTLSWKQHFEWTGLATTEFYLQGDEELRLGRTISPLCDRESHSQLAKSQLGFLRHVVRPLFVELDTIDKHKKAITDALKNLDNNCDRWEQLGETEELIVFSPAVQDIEEEMRGESHKLDVSMLTRADGLTCFSSSHSKTCECKCYTVGLRRLYHHLTGGRPAEEGYEFSDFQPSEDGATHRDDVSEMRIHVNQVDVTGNTCNDDGTASVKTLGSTVTVNSGCPIIGLNSTRLTSKANLADRSGIISTRMAE